jgi:hypothetical protein
VRHVLAPTREDLVDREGECIIAVEGTVINSVFAEKRLANNVTANNDIGSIMLLFHHRQLNILLTYVK